MLKLLFFMGALSLVGFNEMIMMLGVSSVFILLSQSEMEVISTQILWETDSISWSLILLSVWVTILVMLGMMKLNYSRSVYVGLAATLLLSLTFSFCVSDYLGFYLGFECSLVPVFLMVMGYGYQPERLSAGVYLVMYTILGSFPLFVMIILMSNNWGSTYMMGTSFKVGSAVLVLMLNLAFLVKFPIYSGHLWLLKAHVEAPVGGSMILAGVLLKLGGYGMIRFMITWDNLILDLMSFIGYFACWGGMMMALICLRQIDMKLLIASSSVVHMSMCIGVLILMSEMGQKGCVIMMVAHGLASSGLFYLAAGVYTMTGSRSLLIAKGLIMLAPVMTLWWFLMASSNMAAPPTINLLSEISLISSLLKWSLSVMVPLSLMSFLSVAYSLYLYALSSHGACPAGQAPCDESALLNYLGSALHWAPTNILIILVCLFI